jgi:hypothetical protein
MADAEEAVEYDAIRQRKSYHDVPTNELILLKQVMSHPNFANCGLIPRETVDRIFFDRVSYVASMYGSGEKVSSTVYLRSLWTRLYWEEK